MKLQTKERKAFTLAEVLITLAIIGIVAALTIPTLVQNFQQKAWKTAQTVFLQKLKDATRQMNSQKGINGYATTEEFIAALKDYMKFTNICKKGENDKCFASQITILDEDESKVYNTNDFSIATNFGKKYGTNIIGAQLINGTNMLITYNPDCEYVDPYNSNADTTTCISMMYDINGFKGPNEAGKDIYTLNGGKILTGCYKLDSGLCVALEDIEPLPIAMSDPKYDDYMQQTGLYPCTYRGNRCVGYDHLAGAMLACLEIGMRLPTETEFYEIGAHVYNDTHCIGKSDGLGHYCGIKLKGEINNDINMSIGESYYVNLIYYTTETETSASYEGIRFSSNGIGGFTAGRNKNSLDYYSKVRCVK